MGSKNPILNLISYIMKLILIYGDVIGNRTGDLAGTGLEMGLGDGLGMGGCARNGGGAWNGAGVGNGAGDGGW